MTMTCVSVTEVTPVFTTNRGESTKTRDLGEIIILVVWLTETYSEPFGPVGLGRYEHDELYKLRLLTV